jgi:ADP-ribosylglycohydrolase
MFDVLNSQELLGAELDERRLGGYLVDEIAPAIQAAAVDPDISPLEIENLYDTLECTTRRPDWRYQEPSRLEEIVALSPGTDPGGWPGNVDVRDRIHGAWLGRCAGCVLGKPVEANWGRRELRRYLESVNAFPITDYIPAMPLGAQGPEMHPSWPNATRGLIHGMPRDDDTDFTILALVLLERHGQHLTTSDIARQWLASFPFTSVFTAERAAYRNLVHGLTPPGTAQHRNPYREWIGALIRGDMFGYVYPGRPVPAARLAYRDAALSHTANGIYGEMWSAALVAAAFGAASISDALEAAAQVFPETSRLSEAVRNTLVAYRDGKSWDDAMNDIDVSYGAYHWVHSINNAAVISAALLWGDGDFGRTIGLAVEAGLDTDCTGATAGSVFGALHGEIALPSSWTTPLRDTIRSAIFGFEHARISDLADRTFQVASEFRDLKTLEGTEVGEP